MPPTRLVVALQPGCMHPLHAKLREATLIARQRNWCGHYTGAIVVGEIKNPETAALMLRDSDVLLNRLRDAFATQVRNLLATRVASVGTSIQNLQPHTICNILEERLTWFGSHKAVWHSGMFGIGFVLSPFLQGLLAEIGVHSEHSSVGWLALALSTKESPASVDDQTRLASLVPDSLPEVQIRAPWNLVLFQSQQPYVLEKIIDLSYLLEKTIEKECFQAGLSENVVAAMQASVANAVRNVVERTLPPIPTTSPESVAIARKDDANNDDDEEEDGWLDISKIAFISK